MYEKKNPKKGNVVDNEVSISHQVGLSVELTL